MLAISLVVACALFADVTVGKLTPRILNGNNARIEDYPYQVSLDYNNMHACGGSIISKYYVLTAAHCFNVIPDIKHLSVRVGSSYPSRGGRLHKIVSYVAHKDFQSDITIVHDIAIVKVDTPFEYDDKCQPIKLFNVHEDTAAGSQAIITGFGLVDDKNAADQLQSIDLSIISKEECKKSYGDLPVGQICGWGEDGEDSAPGDSGGPIAVNGRLAGIISWGKKGLPSVYTEVTHYRDWIDQRVEYD